MSLDWPWPVLLALVIPPALGHLYHFVLLVNWGSGLGYREPVMDRMRDALFWRTLDLLGPLALDAPAHTVVELVVAALELCRPVRGLGHCDLAVQLMANYPPAPSLGYPWFVRDSRSGPASRNDAP